MLPVAARRARLEPTGTASTHARPLIPAEKAGFLGWNPARSSLIATANCLFWQLVRGRKAGLSGGCANGVKALSAHRHAKR